MTRPENGMVIDASVTMAWCFEDEATEATERLLDRVVREGAIVPVLWFQEVTNVLVMSERRRRLTAAQAARFTTLLSQLPIVTAPEVPSLSTLLGVAREHGLTSYDATYLWLAQSRGLSLATLDDPLRDACRAAGVAVLSA